MNKIRIINTKFWTDGFVLKLNYVKKLLFLYFLTNPETNICGIYECDLKIISFYTGIDVEEILKILPIFKGRIHYIDGWVYIRNFSYYQIFNDKLKIKAKSELDNIPRNIIEKIKEIDKDYDRNPSQELLFSKEEIPDKNNERLESEVNKLFEYYKKRITSKVIKTDMSHQKIKRRLKEKPVEENINRFEELKKAIDMFSGNKWRMDKNKNQGLQFFFKSQEQIVKWLTLSQDKGSGKVIIVGDKK